MTNNKSNSKQSAGKKTQEKKTVKRGGALVDLNKNGNAVFNASDLISKDRPWNAVVNDPMIAALGYMPAPFSSGSAPANYLAGIDTSVVNQIVPQVGAGPKKKTAKAAPAKPKPKKEPASPKKKVAPRKK